MSHGTLTLEGDSRAFSVEHWFSLDRALIRFDGAYALVDRVDTEPWVTPSGQAGWLRTRSRVFKLSGQPASESEKRILHPLVEAMGTTTRVEMLSLTLPAPLEEAFLDDTVESASPVQPLVVVEAPRMNAKVARPGFCYCGTALAIKHDHVETPNLDKCWCGLYLSQVHAHAAAPEQPIARCHCGILLSVPHEHARAYNPNEVCECGLPMNPPHEHAGRLHGR